MTDEMKDTTADLAAEERTNLNNALSVMSAGFARAIQYLAELMVDIDAQSGAFEGEELDSKTVYEMYYSRLSMGLLGEAIQAVGLTPEEVETLEKFFEVQNAMMEVNSDKSKVRAN